jgi:YfiH family protein
VRRAFPCGSPFDRIVAVFTTRHATGDKSSKASNSLEDSPDNHRDAFNALAHATEKLDLDSFTAARQVHGANVCRVTEAERGRGALTHRDAIPATDALVTDLPAVPIGIFTADCVSIFFYDPERMAIGLAHAGWRGTMQSIARNTIEKMRTEFGSNAEDVWAAMGPSIGQCCYEVGADVFYGFQDSFDYADTLFRKTSEEKWHLDLWLANRRQMQDCGIRQERIIESRICSACNSDEFFSARKHGVRAGRTLSVMAIKKPDE